VTDRGDFELGTDGPSMIVVGLDGSRTSWRAAAYAAGLARRQGSRLTIVYVASPNALAAMTPTGFAVMAETLEEIGADLRREVEQLASDRDIDPEFVVVTGDAYAGLCRVAESVHADAVIVGASEHAGHRLIGSLARRLVKSARWPVTVVP
jgi:nucleotide-binding universal stress UspA family protein